MLSSPTVIPTSQQAGQSNGHAGAMSAPGSPPGDVSGLAVPVGSGDRLPSLGAPGGSPSWSELDSDTAAEGGWTPV